MHLGQEHGPQGRSSHGCRTIRRAGARGCRRSGLVTAIRGSRRGREVTLSGRQHVHCPALSGAHVDHNPHLGWVLKPKSHFLRVSSYLRFTPAPADKKSIRQQQSCCANANTEPPRGGIQLFPCHHARCHLSLPLPTPTQQWPPSLVCPGAGGWESAVQGRGWRGSVTCPPRNSTERPLGG